MSKYFAKYLPVEGEIKEGDYYVTAPDYQQVRRCEDRSWGTFEMCKKVKLFLCSRDIQVGDKFWDETENKEFTCTHISGEGDLENTWFCKDDSQYVAKAASFKIIGEISPDATWVKKGDEFDEENIRPCLFREGTDGRYLTVPANSEEELKTWFPNNEWWIGYQIKGPCGHFH